MTHHEIDMNPRKVLYYYSLTVVFCTIIALFLVLTNPDNEALTTFIISQVIGLTGCTCVMLGFYLIRPEKMPALFITLVVTLFTGSVLGVLFGFAATGKDIYGLLRGDFIRAFVIAILFGAIISYFFSSRGIIASKEAMIREERIKRLDMEKKTVETNFRLLQAQIEPHFLFNTLSNILSLMDSDLEKARAMLRDLMQYLRTTLSKSRRESATLGEEVDLIRAYLNIFKIRMGERLRYSVDIPEDLRSFPFPPMLIQPLVENAVRHGLEPEIKGGEIGIRGAVEGDTLRLEVMDSGAGLYEKGNPGVGIENIRERLKSLYGGRARLILEENRPSGVRAIIEVPYGPDEGDYRRR